MENKYFTPSIEELHVGYEAEFALERIKPPFPEGGTYIETWIPFTFQGVGQEVIFYHNRGMYRTPFLTKEQIEAEGWEPGYVGHFKNGFKLRYLKEDLRLIIQVHDQILFSGNCKCINTLRQICKLLNIN